LTLCVALATSRGVWIGADSGSTLEHATEVCRQPKVWRTANGWLVASAGNWRALEIMRYDLEFPSPTGNLHRALCMDLQTSLAQAFERNNFELKKDSEGDVTVEEAYDLLVAHGNDLFSIDYTGHTEPVKRAAIGTGAEYALGLIDHCDLGSPERRIRKALVTAAKRYRCLIGPYVIERA
jgi:hypothetical protein